MSAMQGPLESIRPSSSSRNFSGTGRTLSGETVPAPAPQPPESIVHNIIFWRNGFTVNGGPLRRLDDPKNASFLESIGKSKCSRELAPADSSRGEATLVEGWSTDHPSPKNYTTYKVPGAFEPEKPQVPFQGVGRTLGSSSTIATSELSASAPINTQTPSTFLVDESLPSTSLQLRLADGTRIVAPFNYHHAVGDIRAFIDASRPSAIGDYQLQTVGFPPKSLSDPSQTIEQAGLANSVVMQKL
ncbi:plant UBX domain-containing protein 4-like [Nicotiana sylvestris]|uniref:plant UBX domain-containing protein 4-like n=1 Tax=Nicotiana sylvestris TaxID=4096 RepID=UPI00388C7441